MPELPEVEAVCRRLRASVLGARIVQLRVVRPGIVRPQTVTAVENGAADAVIEAVERRGKHILIRLSGERLLHVHLRMTGNLVAIPDVRFRGPGARVWMELSDGRGLVYEDPRALGKVHLRRVAELDGLLKDVGVEPLSDTFDATYFRNAARRSQKPAKIFLMDQKCVAGLGNIYAAEALWRAKIHPSRPMAKLKGIRVDGLHQTIREVMTEAMESASAAYAEAGGFSTEEWFVCNVYDREGLDCPRCGRKIKRIPQGGRSTYYCPGCQR